MVRHRAQHIEDFREPFNIQPENSPASSAEFIVPPGALKISQQQLWCVLPDDLTATSREVIQNRSAPAAPRSFMPPQDVARPLLRFRALDIDIGPLLKCLETAVIETSLWQPWFGFFKRRMPVHIVEPHAVKAVACDELPQGNELCFNESLVGRTNSQKPGLAR